MSDRFCTECGRERDGDDAFCQGCGARLESPGAPPAPAESAPAGPASRLTKAAPASEPPVPSSRTDHQAPKDQPTSRERSPRQRRKVLAIAAGVIVLAGGAAAAIVLATGSSSHHHVTVTTAVDATPPATGPTALPPAPVATTTTAAATSTGTTTAESTTTTTGTTTAPASTATTNTATAPAVSVPTAVYRGHAFSINYPSSWRVQDTEQQTSYGTDTTFVSPASSHILLRIDVTAHPADSDPMAAADPVVAAVSQQTGYRQIDLSRDRFDGFPAAHWEFQVRASGLLLQQEDYFFTDPQTGASIAVLTGAPAGDYRRLDSEFAQLRRTLTMH